MRSPRVRIPEPPTRKSAIAIEGAVADLVRRVHRAEQRAHGGEARTLSATVHAMALVYIQKEHPDWLDEQQDDGGSA